MTNGLIVWGDPTGSVSEELRIRIGPAVMLDTVEQRQRPKAAQQSRKAMLPAKATLTSPPT
jgi:hypothetical protein